VILELEEVHAFINKSHILQNVGLTIEEGELVALMGRNGVGKSTTLKSIMGMVVHMTGSIRFREREIMGSKTFRIAKQGIGYVPEERRIFPNLTVRQNLVMGIKSSVSAGESWTIERVFEYFPQLEKRQLNKGGNLSGGEQQMLSIGRTLMGNPELILVDEPTEGLAPLLREMVVKILREMNQRNCSILLVEQAMDVAMDLATRVYVMSKGQIVFSGSSQELKADKEIRRRYLEV
jgi:branched-chain amino acid transport system ATP-binding protein